MHPLQSDSVPLPVLDQVDPPTIDWHSGIFKYFHTCKNLFGLSHRYFASQFPTHNPEQWASLIDLCHNPIVDDATSNNQCKSTTQFSNSMFYPYPNETSFHLGHWYWNGGVQKS